MVPSLTSRVGPAESLMLGESTGRVLGERRMKTLWEMAVEARTANKAARDCAEILRHNPHDISFTPVYLLDENGRQLQVAGHAGSTTRTGGSKRIPLDCKWLQ